MRFCGHDGILCPECSDRIESIMIAFTTWLAQKAQNYDCPVKEQYWPPYVIVMRDILKEMD